MRSITNFAISNDKICKRRFKGGAKNLFDFFGLDAQKNQDTRTVRLHRRPNILLPIISLSAKILF